MFTSVYEVCCSVETNHKYEEASKSDVTAIRPSRKMFLYLIFVPDEIKHIYLLLYSKNCEYLFVTCKEKIMC